jgi:hypothetical protein
MRLRLAPVLLFALVFTPAIAKDKKKATLPAYVLQAQTVVVIVDPDAGEPVDQPYANKTARENVETALLKWGRFDLVNDGQPSDLIITVRTGNGKTVRPTIHGGGIDQRPGVAEGDDSTIRIGAHQGQPPDPGTGPTGMPPSGLPPEGMPPQGTPSPQAGPHVSNEAGPSEDMFEVFRGNVNGNVDDPLNTVPAWRYSAKDCLSSPKVTAVEEFRKAIADAEKPKPKKKP